jgi:hypothetical protein
MPKMTGTKKQKAEELLTRIQRGPSFDEIGLSKFTPCEAERQYRLWMKSWIRDDLINLIPELKEYKES